LSSPSTSEYDTSSNPSSPAVRVATFALGVFSAFALGSALALGLGPFGEGIFPKIWFAASLSVVFAARPGDLKGNFSPGFSFSHLDSIS